MCCVGEFGLGSAVLGLGGFGFGSAMFGSCKFESGCVRTRSGQL